MYQAFQSDPFRLFYYIADKCNGIPEYFIYRACVLEVLKTVICCPMSYLPPYDNIVQSYTFNSSHIYLYK